MLSRLHLSYGCRRPTVGRGLHDQVDSSNFAELGVVRVIEVYAKTVFEVLIRTVILFFPECAHQGRNVDERSSPETDVRWALSRRHGASHCNALPGRLAEVARRLRGRATADSDEELAVGSAAVTLMCQ